MFLPSEVNELGQTIDWHFRLLGNLRELTRAKRWYRNCQAPLMSMTRSYQGPVVSTMLRPEKLSEIFQAALNYGNVQKHPTERYVSVKVTNSPGSTSRSAPSTPERLLRLKDKTRGLSMTQQCEYSSSAIS